MNCEHKWSPPTVSHKTNFYNGYFGKVPYLSPVAIVSCEVCGEIRTKDI